MENFEMENGVKVMLEPISEHETNVYTRMPDEKGSRFAGNWGPHDGTLFMVRYSKHLHRILNAYGMSAYVLDILEKRGLNKLILRVEDTKEVLETTLENAKEHGVWKYWKEGGFDRQLFLAVPWWEKRRSA